MMIEEVVDKAGRVIKLRRVGMLETLRLFKALGPELSINEAYVGTAKIAVAAAMIDGIPVPFPVNEAGVEALVDRLGEDGADAIADAIHPLPAAEVIAQAGN